MTGLIGNVLRNVYLIVARALQVNASEKRTLNRCVGRGCVKAGNGINVCYVCRIVRYSESEYEFVCFACKSGCVKGNVLTCRSAHNGG